MDIITKLANDPERCKRLIEELKKREAEKLAAMSPEELAEYKAKQEEEDAYQDYLAQPAPITRGDLMAQEDAFGVAYDEIASDRDYIKEKADKATASQGGTDRALTKALARIKELEQRQITTDADGFEVEEVITDNGEARLTDEELKAELPPEMIAQILAERTADARGKKAKHATSSQSGTDTKLTKALARIRELEAEVAELKHQRDELLKRLLAATGAEVVA